MRTHRITLALLATFCALGFVGAAHAETTYDGLWQVTVVTKAGSCEPTTVTSVTVSNGVIQGGTDITGKVSRDGLVRISMGGVYAQGQLEGKTGSGKWNAASSGVPCSGQWQAARQ